MHCLIKAEFGILLGNIALILLVAKLLAYICRKINLPTVVGELLAGIILGPTVLGSLHPIFTKIICPNTGNLPLVFDTLFNFSLIILLLSAGLEIDFLQIVKSKKSTLYTSLLGIVIPFSIGFMLIYLCPSMTLSSSNQGIGMAASFFGIALSISALPVLVRLLSELNLFNNNIGVIITSVALVTDIVAWLAFSLIVSLHKHLSVISSLCNFLIFLVFISLMLTKSSYVFERIFTRIKNESQLTALAVVGFGCAFFTEYLGFHASIGAFIAGVSLHKFVKGSAIEKQLTNFVNSFFAPLFFVSIGLKLNFLTNFNLSLIISVIILAFTTKVIGASLGAYLSGINLKPSLAIGFGLNVRGSIEIIICTIAFNIGLISESMFVAFVIMAIATSLISGPIMQRLLRKEIVLN